MTRLDAALVRAGLVRSRAQAKALLDQGRVLVDGAVVSKAAHAVTDDASLELVGEVDPWVGRAAHKLLAALEAFPEIVVAGRRALDVGASTGGFTQVLLTRGAASVCALDVGHGQLVAEVADDPRVDERSGVNVRYVEPDELGGPFQLLVSDLSFISLTLVLDRLRALTLPGADLVLLVKPQFEVGRDRLGRTGVVRSTEQRVEAVVRVAAEAERMGLTVHGLARSPIAGGDGNVEVLLWCRHPSADPPPRPGLSVDAARVEPLVVDRAGGPPRPSKETLS